MPWKNRVGLPGTGIPHVWGNRTHPAECSNSSNISPTQPRRAKTCRSAGKAAGESKPEEVPTAFRVSRSLAAMIFGERKTPSRTSDLREVLLKVEGLNDTRAQLADCFSLRLGPHVDDVRHTQVDHIRHGRSRLSRLRLNLQRSILADSLGMAHDFVSIGHRCLYFVPDG